MRYRHIALLAIILGAIMAWFIKDQHGFVLIAWDKHTLEMRLWIFTTLAILFTIAVFISAWLLMTVKRTGRSLSRWRSSRGEKKSRNQTLAGLIALTEGHWQKAEQMFNRSAQKAESRLLNYLLAAKAAQEQKDYVKRDDYLQMAAEHEPEASIAVSVTQAELQYESGQYEHALATLAQLWNKDKRHPYVLKLLAKCYYQLKDWQNLFDLLPAIKKHRIVAKEQYLKVEHESVRGLLIRKAKTGCEQLQQTWQQFPSDYQKNKRYVALFAQLLLELKAKIEAEAVLRHSLKRGYDRDLAYWYGLATGRDQHNQLNFAEGLKSDGDNDWQLNLSLARLCFDNQLWGKAKDYALKSFNLQPTLEAHQLLLKTMQQLNESTDTINDVMTRTLTVLSDQAKPMLISKSQELLVKQ